MLQKMQLYMTSKNEEARDDLAFHFPNMIIYASTRYSLIDMFLPKLPYFKKGNKFHNLLKILCFHTIMHQEDCVDKVMQMCHRKWFVVVSGVFFLGGGSFFDHSFLIPGAAKLINYLWFIWMYDNAFLKKWINCQLVMYAWLETSVLLAEVHICYDNMKKIMCCIIGRMGDISFK